MSSIMFVALVAIFAVVLSMHLARRRARVTQIDRTIVRKKENGTGA